MLFDQHKRLILVFLLLLIIGVFIAAISLPQKENSSIEDSINSAAVLIRDGSPGEGLKTMQAISEQHPDDPKVFFLIAWWLEGLAMDRSGDIKNPAMQQEALRYMKTAVALAPDDVNYRLFYAGMLADVIGGNDQTFKEAIRQYKVAFQQIERSSAKNSESVRTAVGIYADLMVHLGRRDEAEREVRLWLEASDFHEQVYGPYVYIISLRSFTEARSLVDEYFRNQGFSQYVLTLLCDGQYDRKHFEEAQECFKEVQNGEVDRDYLRYAERMIREIDNVLERRSEEK